MIPSATGPAGETPPSKYDIILTHNIRGYTEEGRQRRQPQVRPGRPPRGSTTSFSYQISLVIPRKNDDAVSNRSGRGDPSEEVRQNFQTEYPWSYRGRTAMPSATGPVEETTPRKYDIIVKQNIFGHTEEGRRCRHQIFPALFCDTLRARATWTATW